MPETPQEAFERGVTAGEIAARLADHDQHLAKINGSMGRVADEMARLVLGQQAIVDRMTSAAATVITTAAALEKADALRRETSDSRWTPLTRLSLVFGLVVGAVVIIGGVYAFVR